MARRRRGKEDAPLEAGLNVHVAILRVNVNHADVAQYRTALVRRCFRAQRTKVCVVRLERVKERVARGDGRECEGRGDEGERRHGGVTVWEERRRLRWIRIWGGGREETGEDGQFTRHVGAV